MEVQGEQLCWLVLSKRLVFLHVGPVSDHGAWDLWVPPSGPLWRREAVQTGFTGPSLGQVPDTQKRASRRG